MLIHRLWYEARVMGKPVIFMPPLIMIAFMSCTSLLRITSHEFNVGLTACVEMFLPLAAGLLSIATMTHDPACELQLALPTPYSRTMFWRLRLIVVWTALIACLACLLNREQIAASLRQIQSWPPLVRMLTGQLSYLAPLLWFTAAGLLLALLLRSQATSSVLLGGIWFADIILGGLVAGIPLLHPTILFATTFLPLASFWLSNRIEVMVTSLLLLGMGKLLLHNMDAHLQKWQGDA